MKTLIVRRVAIAIAAAMLAASPMTRARAEGAVPPGNGPASVADLAEGLLDAVVNIATTSNGGPDNSSRRPPRMQAPEGSPFQDFFDEFFKDREGQGPRNRSVSSLGSGFVIDSENGYIVTNNHVIEGADEIEANFADGSKLKAELIGTDPKTDLAVLQVKSDRPLKAVPFGNSETMRIGDWVMAIGNPFGLGGSVSIGIVSARGRDINSGPYDNFIQTDAAINRGNSGGPLFNMNGEVIGINTAIISPSGGSIGIGFAVPTELAESIIRQLIEFGEPRRGWLGVRIQPVTDDIAESLGMSKAAGALVAGVVRGGPADGGKLLAGDVITAFDGRDIGEMRDLPRIVAESPEGKKSILTVIRKGETIEVEVTLGRLKDGSEAVEETGEAGEPDEKTEEMPADVEVLGMALAELTPELREEFSIAENVDGVVITDVDADSVAAEKMIEPGMVIVELAQEAIKDPQELADRIAELKKDGRRNALLMLAAPTGELRFVTIRME